MATFIKLFIIILLSTIVIASEEKIKIDKKAEALVCIRWQWRGEPVNGKSTCIEWAKKDCSNRLFPELCKLGG